MPDYRLPGGGGRRPLNAVTEQLNIDPQGKTRRIWRFVAAAVVLGVLVVAAIGWGSLSAFDNSLGFPERQAEQIQSELSHSPAQVKNVLVALRDAQDRSGTTGNSLLLVHVDPQAEKAWVLWIPSNVLELVPGHGQTALGNAWRYGGSPATIKAVKDLTGQSINDYLEVDVSAIRKAVDAVGGSWVVVPTSIESTTADTSPKQNATTLQPGAQLLDGYHALTFVRAPASLADQGYGRLQNQRLLLDSLGPKVSQTASGLKALSLFAAVSPYVKSTMNLGTLDAFQRQLRGIETGGIYYATVPGAWKAGYITPDASVLGKLMADMRAGRPFGQPSADLAKAALQSTTVIASKPPSQTSVTVANGGGISGAAKQAAGALQTQGFRIKSVGNANLNVYKQTLVVYKTDPSLARSVAQYLPPGVKIVRSFGFYTFDTDVLVVVGRDWNPSNVPVAPIQTQ